MGTRPGVHDGAHSASASCADRVCFGSRKLHSGPQVTLASGTRVSVLAEIGTQGRLVHERKYTDFVLMLATESLVTENQRPPGEVRSPRPTDAVAG
jgi:hypothetical protein